MLQLSKAHEIGSHAHTSNQTKPSANIQRYVEVYLQWICNRHWKQLVEKKTAWGLLLICLSWTAWHPAWLYYELLTQTGNQIAVRVGLWNSLTPEKHILERVTHQAIGNSLWHYNINNNNNKTRNQSSMARWRRASCRSNTNTSEDSYHINQSIIVAEFGKKDLVASNK